MTALFVAPRVPLVDPKTGIINPIWYRLFEQLFSTAGVGSVPDSSAFDVSPSINPDQIMTALEQIGNDLSPSFPEQKQTEDDVSPMVSALAAEVAALRALVDDIRKGTVSL